MNWYLDVLRKYAVFEGRSRRAEYWYFFLYNVLFGIAAAIVDILAGTYNKGLGIGLVGVIYALAVLLPSLAVAIRRLHDTNRSGWWLLIAFIPLAGAIALIVFYAQDSDPGDNTYGPNPKSAPTAR